jgi:hypothetical protein
VTIRAQEGPGRVPLRRDDLPIEVLRQRALALLKQATSADLAGYVVSAVERSTSREFLLGLIEGAERGFQEDLAHRLRNLLVAAEGAAERLAEFGGSDEHAAWRELAEELRRALYGVNRHIAMTYGQ